MGSYAAVEKQLRRNVLTKTANYTVTSKDHGCLFVAGAVDLVFTLPPANAISKGMELSFQTQTLSTTTGLQVSPAAVDKIMGKGITAADDKDLINTAATDAVGDTVTLVCDGVDGWYIKSMLGTWARQA